VTAERRPAGHAAIRDRPDDVATVVDDLDLVVVLVRDVQKTVRGHRHAAGPAKADRPHRIGPKVGGNLVQAVVVGGVDPSGGIDPDPRGAVPGLRKVELVNDRPAVPQRQQVLAVRLAGGGLSMGLVQEQAIARVGRARRTQGVDRPAGADELRRRRERARGLIGRCVPETRRDRVDLAAD
jgi:hypothetical protein